MDMRYVGVDGKIKIGPMVMLQQLGEMADGKIHFVAGRDADVFNIEEGDKFFTAIFVVNPFDD